MAIIVCMVMLMASNDGDIDDSIFGLAITSGMLLATITQLPALRQSAELKNSLTSIERFLQNQNLKSVEKIEKEEE